MICKISITWGIPLLSNFVELPLFPSAKTGTVLLKSSALQGDAILSADGSVPGRTGGAACGRLDNIRRRSS